MTPPENPTQLHTEALLLQLELEAGCYCHAISPERRPCQNHRSAAMIGRLLKALSVDPETAERSK